MSANFKIYVWKRAPFLRLLAPLIAGILIQYYLELPLILIFIFWFLSFSIFIGVNYLPLWFRFKYPQIRGVSITLLFLFSGAAIIHINNIQNDNHWFGNHLHQNDILQLRILKPIEEKRKSFKVLAEALSVSDSGKAITTKGQVILYLQKDSASASLQYGDEIYIKNKLKPIKNNGNPGSFDYADYMAKRQIFHSGYFTPEDYFITGKNDQNPVRRILFDIQAYVMLQIDKYISGNRERALTKALLIGYRLDVDNELLQAYSNAGVVHLIAISGLHVGIIYAMLLFFASKINFLKNRNVLRVILILAFIWIFAFVTGASPSVLRASCMFSFISIGGLFKTNTFIYNSMAASAFFLLIFDPFILWNVGFQLSYLSVFGIVSTQKHIYHWLYIPNEILDFIWQIATVSIGAQLFTLPVCIYYFHQVPMLFLFANILLIPVATVVLWGSVFIILLSFVPVAALFLSLFISYAVSFMNYIVLKISSLSFSVWDMIHLHLYDVYILYFIFISGFFWMANKNKTSLKIALFFTFFLSISFYADDWQKSRQRKMIIYNYPRATVIDFFHGKRFFSKADDRVYFDKVSFSYNVIPARVIHSTKKEMRPSEYFEKEHIVVFGGKKMLVLDSAQVHLTSKQKPLFDYILLTYNSPVKIRELAEMADSRLLIFDNSNSNYKINQWKKECEELHLQFHCVPEQGAFITDI